jgi:acyl-CoA thioesterase
VPVEFVAAGTTVTVVDPQSVAEASARVMLDADEASRSAGIGLTSVGPGMAEVTMTVTARMCNGHAIAHGGYLFLLADTAFALACNSFGAVTVAAGCDIDFLVSARAGDVLSATATERSRAGRSGLYDVTVRRADGTVVAEMRGRSRTLRGVLVEGVDDARPEPAAG